MEPRSRSVQLSYKVLWFKVLKNNEASLWKTDSKMAPSHPRLLLATLQCSPLPQGTGLACRTNTILQNWCVTLTAVTEGFCFSVLNPWRKPVTTLHSRITKHREERSLWRSPGPQWAPTCEALWVNHLASPGILSDGCGLWSHTTTTA